MSPSFCNNQTLFSLDDLETILPELKDRWTEVKGLKPTSSNLHKEGLWKHEWRKHGTCAMSLPTLNTELKYFKQGLDWSKQYPLSDILFQGDIKPNGTYPVVQFWHTLKTRLGKNPRIECFVDSVCIIFKVNLCSTVNNHLIYLIFLEFQESLH